MPKLADADLTLVLDKVTYRRRAKRLQTRLVQLQREVYQLGIPVVMVFEGWDAAGKGGSIRRLLEHVDPRGYQVHPVSAPTSDELAHHYLWRFWSRLPTKGRMAIFDRSWYGRVLVERVEGFASKEEWRRAYAEINVFERLLTDSGHVIAKFFLHISKDEQKRRFDDRAKDTLRAWKLTDEDHRNRRKWGLYEKATDDMLVKTSVPAAPWTLVPANDKVHARWMVQDTVVRVLEKAVAKAKRG